MAGGSDAAGDRRPDEPVDTGHDEPGGTRPSEPRGTGPVEPEDPLERLFRSGRTNAVVAWLAVGVLGVAFAESVLDPDYQWTVFVAAAGAIVCFPPVAFRDWRVMLPWEVLAVVLLPVLVRGSVGGELGTFASFLAIAGLALVVTVELHTFTSLQVSHAFALALVVLTTIASVVAWSIVRWNLDRAFGTSYLTTNDALMVEFVWVSLAGVAAGLLFDVYFQRRDRQLWRLIRGERER